MRREKLQESAQAFETHLGSPFSPSNIFNFSELMKLDEAEAFPERQLRFLFESGANLLTVPARAGGPMTSYDEVIEVMKAVGRRDTTTLISIGKNFLGSLPVFMFGDQNQQKAVADCLRNHGFVSLAITEQGNGSDLLSTQTSVLRSPEGGRYLSGKKWLINNIEICDFAVVLARTAMSGGPKGFGLFLVNPKEAAGDLRFGEKIRTHGVRGMKMGSVEFKSLHIEKRHLISEADGFMQTLKLFQVSRSMCAGLGLGAVETGLRLTTEFTLKRRLYGKPLSELAIVRHRLSEVYLRLKCLEAVSYFCARAVSFFPEELSVISAFAKYYVPSQCELLLQELSQTLGARYYLREGWYDGYFQKALRDVSLVPLFDGSTQVNLYVISNQLSQLLAPDSSDADLDLELLGRCFELNVLPDAPDFSRLQVTNRGKNSLVQGLLRGSDPEVLVACAELSQSLQADASEVNRFYLAQKYCSLMALACVQGNQKTSSRLSEDAFRGIRSLLHADLAGATPKDLGPQIFQELERSVEADRTLGLLDYSIGPWFAAEKGKDFV